MSDLDKLRAFGNWLVTLRAQKTAELYELGINRLTTIDAIRVKAGQLEATGFILDAFKELYNGDLEVFLKTRLGIEPDKESHAPPNV